jgi:hypothetical protein
MTVGASHQPLLALALDPRAETTLRSMLKSKTPQFKDTMQLKKRTGNLP